MTVRDAAQTWGVTERYVQMMCKQGLVRGAARWGRGWMVPADAPKPQKRARGAQESSVSLAEQSMPLPRKTPFLYMTSLYNRPGCARETYSALEYNHEAQVLFAAEIEYLRGNIDAVYERASYLLGKHSGLYAVLSAGMLLGLCAMWRGDIGMWNRAKRHICDAPCRNDAERDMLSLSLTALDSSVFDVSSFPEWFKMGNFEPLHPDTLPAAKVYYAKYLYAAGYAVASREYELKGFQGLSLMSMLPYTIEPMISQALADGTVIVEIHLRLICATIYHNIGKEADAKRHIDRAVALALPDKLYGILTEHRRQLDSLLDERLELIDKQALAAVRALYRQFSEGWSSLSGTVRNRIVTNALTTRELEVAKLAAFGLSNAEIAEKLHISVASVKQAVRLAIYKSGVENKAALASVL